MAEKLKVHAQSINGCVWLEGDRKLATVSDDYTLRIWDYSNNEYSGVMEGHSGRVVDITTKGNERDKVVTASWDRSFGVWDIRREQNLWYGSDQSIATSCCSSVWHDLIAVGLDSSAVSLWDGRVMEKMVCLQGHDNTITCVRISGDGTRLCSTSMDRSARVWDLRTRKTVLVLTGPRNVISSCCFSPNGHYLCLSSWDKMLRVYDIALGTFRRKGPIVLSGHEGCVSSCVYSNDGCSIISGGYDQLVNVHSSIENPNPRPSLRGHDSWINSVCFNSSDEKVAACGKDGVVYVWNLDHIKKHYDSFMPTDQSVYDPIECKICKRLFNIFGPTGDSVCVLCRASELSAH